ncbi:60Kd inner membrane protein-domain-containing protein [Mycena floridula]|nr:60Kd inner membrane protein-domain-containing protein [Mycena floridula]
MSFAALSLRRPGAGILGSSTSRLVSHRAFHVASRQFSHLTLASRWPSANASFSPNAPFRPRSFWSSTPAPKPTEQPFIPDTPVSPIPNEAASTISVDNVPEFIPDIPSELTDTIVNIIPPLQYGDFASMGLLGYHPAGLMRWTFELLNVSTGMTWFWTIVVGTVMWRIVAVPLNIFTARSTAKIAPFKDQIAALHKESRAAMAIGDRETMAQKTAEISAIYKSSGFHPLAPAGAAVGQLTIGVSSFFAVTEMCYHPVAQLTQSGFALVPDLTVPPETWLLPIALVAAAQLQIYIMTGEMKRLGESSPINVPPWVWHALGFLPIWIMISFPSGLFVSMTTTSLCLAIQGMLFRIPALRELLGMPPLAPIPKEPRVLVEEPVAPTAQKILFFQETPKNQNKSTKRK